MRRVIVIGDVHGCIEELEKLLSKVDPRPEDRLFFLGDLVDRGPHSLEVIRRVATLIQEYPGSVCVAGNHEEKALRYREHDRPGRPWTEQATAEDWEFLDSLPLFHRITGFASRPLLLLHGGLFPAYFDKHGELGEPSPTWRKDRGKRAKRLARTLRIRKVNAAGNMVSLQDEGPEDVHWIERYAGQEGVVLFGHDPQVETAEPLRGEHALGLDTGCCFGGRLSAAILEPGLDPATATIVSVPGHAYANPRKPFAE